MTNFQVRKSNPADKDALNDLYRRITNIDRSDRQFHWEWTGGPYGPSPSWVIVEAASDKVVGHHGVIPVPLWVNGRRILAARTENTMIDPDFAGKFIYHAYEAKLLRELCEAGYEILFTTSGKGAWGVIRRRLGYQQIGRWRTHVIETSFGYRARRLVGPFGAIADIADLAARRSALPGLTLQASDAFQEAEDIWQRSAPAEGIFPNRERVYLDWRVRDHPYHSHQMAMLARERRNIGYVIWHQQNSAGRAVDILIDDIFVEGEEEETYRQTLALFVSTWAGKGARITLRTLDTDTPLARAIRQIAPRSNATPLAADSAELLAFSTSDMPVSDWRVTQLIAQGI